MDLMELTKEAMARGAMQKPAELFNFLERVVKDPPGVVVEIGTAKGGTLYALCKAARLDALIVSIDLQGGPFGGGCTEEEADVIKTYAGQGQQLHLIRGDSHRKATLARLQQALDGRKADLLFIDGDHTYEGVKADYEMYGPLVADGGMIALHDVCYHTYNQDCRVDLFWEEARNQYPSYEIVDKSNMTWGGIGVIFKKMLAPGDSGLLLDIGRGEIQDGFERATHDLETFPWPYDDNSVHICVGAHVIEHIRPWLVFDFFNELWRVMKPNGQVALSTPYAGSPGWYGDPSHCTAFNHISFTYLDPDYATYLAHRPRPWRIEKGHPVYKTDGNLECVLRARK